MPTTYENYGFQKKRVSILLYAQIAQSVEQGTENPRVIGSIPLGGTTFQKNKVTPVLPNMRP